MYTLCILDIHIYLSLALIELQQGARLDEFPLDFFFDKGTEEDSTPQTPPQVLPLERSVCSYPTGEITLDEVPPPAIVCTSDILYIYIYI